MSADFHLDLELIQTERSETPTIAEGTGSSRKKRIPINAILQGLPGGSSNNSAKSNKGNVSAGRRSASCSPNITPNVSGKKTPVVEVAKKMDKPVMPPSSSRPNSNRASPALSQGYASRAESPAEFDHQTPSTFKRPSMIATRSSSPDSIDLEINTALAKLTIPGKSPRSSPRHLHLRGTLSRQNSSTSPKGSPTNNSDSSNHSSTTSKAKYYYDKNGLNTVDPTEQLPKQEINELDYMHIYSGDAVDDLHREQKQPSPVLIASNDGVGIYDNSANTGRLSRHGSGHGSSFHSFISHGSSFHSFAISDCSTEYDTHNHSMSSLPFVSPTAGSEMSGFISSDEDEDEDEENDVEIEVHRYEDDPYPIAAHSHSKRRRPARRTAVDPVVDPVDPVVEVAVEVAESEQEAVETAATTTDATEVSSSIDLDVSQISQISVQSQDEHILEANVSLQQEEALSKMKEEKVVTNMKLQDAFEEIRRLQEKISALTEDKKELENNIFALREQNTSLLSENARLSMQLSTAVSHPNNNTTNSNNNNNTSQAANLSFSSPSRSEIPHSRGHSRTNSFNISLLSNMMEENEVSLLCESDDSSKLMLHVRDLVLEAGDCLTELEADRALIQETIQKLTAEGSDDTLLRQKYNREMELMFTEEDDNAAYTPSRKPSSSGNSTPRSRRPSLSRENSGSSSNSPAKPSKKQLMARLSPKGGSGKNSAHSFEGF